MVSISLVNSMLETGFTPKEISAYLNGQLKKLTFNKTKNRILFARLDKAVEMTNHILSSDFYYKDDIKQLHASEFCNQLLV